MTELVLKTVGYILIFILIISCFFLVKTMQGSGQTISNMNKYLDIETNSIQGEIKDDFSFQRITFSNDILNNTASRELFVLRKIVKDKISTEEPVKKPETAPELIAVKYEEQPTVNIELEPEKLIENPFILLGISVEKEGGLAILLNTKNSKTEIIGKGDFLEEFKIISISKDCVVIEKEGQSFCLEFEK